VKEILRCAPPLSFFSSLSVYHLRSLKDVVTLTDDVTSRAIVRQSPSGQSDRVGSFDAPGQRAELIGSVPNWYEVRLGNGLAGFVRKRWTRVISLGPPPPPPPIITELEERGQIFRTDLDDVACATNPKKVGPDNDGKAGGCDNVRITMQGTMIQEYFR